MAGHRAFVAGAVCVLALIERPQVSGGAGATEQIHVFAMPHWSVPSDANAAAGVAKSDRLRPEAAMASVTNEASSAASATQIVVEPPGASEPAATAAKASHRHVARKSYRHDRRNKIAHRDAAQRHNYGAWGFGGFTASRNATWFSGIN